MKRTQRLTLISILLAGVAIGTVACGGPDEAPSPEEATTEPSVETVSLEIEGMT